MPHILYWFQQDETPLPRIKAMCSYLFPYGKGGQQRQRCFYQVHFWGSDVPDDVDGYPHLLEIFLDEEWDLPELRTALIQSIKDKAEGLGLRVNSLDIYIPTYETG